MINVNVKKLSSDQINQINNLGEKCMFGLFTHRRFNQVLLAIEGDKVHGFLGYTINYKRKSTEISSISIEYLCVDTNERGKKIGTQMIEKLLSKYSNSGFNIVIPNNNSARNGKGSFYIQFGFEPINKNRKYLVYLPPNQK